MLSCILEGTADELVQVSTEKSPNAYSAVCFLHHSTGAFIYSCWRATSAHNNPNREAIYTDQDSYQIYATLLEGEKHSMNAIEADIHGYSDLTSKNLDMGAECSADMALIIFSRRTSENGMKCLSKPQWEPGPRESKFHIRLHIGARSLSAVSDARINGRMMWRARCIL